MSNTSLPPLPPSQHDDDDGGGGGGNLNRRHANSRTKSYLNKDRIILDKIIHNRINSALTSAFPGYVSLGHWNQITHFENGMLIPVIGWNIPPQLNESVDHVLSTIQQVIITMLETLNPHEPTRKELKVEYVKSASEIANEARNDYTQEFEKASREVARASAIGCCGKYVFLLFLVIDLVSATGAYFAMKYI